MTVHTAEQRRQRRQREAHRAILDAASSILLEDGYEHFTMRKLADRCGYTAPTIYHHFGDKKGLIDALLEEVFRELVSQLKEVQSHPDPLDDMRAQFHAFVRFALRNPTHYRLLTTPRAGEDEPPPSGEEARELLQRPMQELSDSGRLRGDSLEAVRQSFWALLHGLISLQTHRPEYEWAPELIETSLEAMIAGLIRDSGATASPREAEEEIRA